MYHLWLTMLLIGEDSSVRYQGVKARDPAARRHKPWVRV